MSKAKGKGKKGADIPLKVTPKIESDAEQVQELQLKKKFMEERYCITLLLKISKCC